MQISGKIVICSIRNLFLTNFYTDKFLALLSNLILHMKRLFFSTSQNIQGIFVLKTFL